LHKSGVPQIFGTLREDEILLKEKLKNKFIGSVSKTNEIYNTYLSYSKVLNNLNKKMSTHRNQQLSAAQEISRKKRRFEQSSSNYDGLLLYKIFLNTSRILRWRFLQYFVAASG